MSRYLVTGCAGFIGSTLVDALLAEGSQVVGVDAFTDYYPRDRKEAAIATAASHPAFELVEHDLGDRRPRPTRRWKESTASSTSPPGRACARAGARDSSRTSTTTFSPRTPLPSAPPDAGLRVVFASSSSVYGDALAYPTREDAAPGPGVALRGHQADLRAPAARPLPGTSSSTTWRLRYFTVYGPRQRPDMAFARLVGSLVGGPSFEVYGDGTQSRDFTYVQDAVAATILAMRKAPPGAIYNVGGGSEATLRDSVAIVEELSGRTLDVGYGEVAAGDVRRTLADTERIRGEVGWEPAVDLRTGLASMLEAAGVIVPAGRGND